MFNRAKAAFSSVASTTQYAVKTAITFAIGSSMTSTSEARVCFEQNDHDYSLDCVGSEIALLPYLETCGIYTDQYDDCANFFIEKTSYGEGTFGGTCCDLSSHIALQSTCLEKVLSENVGKCYGTEHDVLVTAGIVVGGVIVLCCLMSGCCYVIRSASRAAEARELREPTIEQMLNDHLISMASAPSDDKMQEEEVEFDEPSNPDLETAVADLPRRSSLTASALRLFNNTKRGEYQPGVAMATSNSSSNLYGRRPQ